MKKDNFEKKSNDNELNKEILDEVDKEFQDLASKLSNIDFSKDSNKDFVLNNILKNTSNMGVEDMKNSKKIKKTGIIAASGLIVCTLMMQTAFAQDIVGKVINKISLGYITVFQDEENHDSNITEMPVPTKLKGKLFDKDGNEIKKFTKDMDKTFYTADGKEIDYFEADDGKIVTVEETEKHTLIVKDPNKINDYTCFKVKLPSYLPEGYSFDKAEFYKDDSGNVKDSKYAQLQFKNLETGKVIHMGERFACEETKSESGGEKVEKIKINDVDAVLSDDRNIDWVADGTIYSLHGNELNNKDELIKIAESIK